MNHKRLFAHLTIALSWRGFSWPWKLCSRVKPFAPAGTPHSPLSQKQLFFLLGRGTMMFMPLGCFRGWNVNPGMPNFKKRPTFETSTLCSHPHVLDLFKVANSQVSHFTESHMEVQLHKNSAVSATSPRSSSSWCRGEVAEITC